MLQHIIVRKSRKQIRYTNKIFIWNIIRLLQLLDILIILEMAETHSPLFILIIPTDPTDNITAPRRKYFHANDDQTKL